MALYSSRKEVIFVCNINSGNRVISPPSNKQLRIDVKGHQEELLVAEEEFNTQFGFLFPDFLVTNDPNTATIFLENPEGIQDAIRKFFRDRKLLAEITENKGD